MVFGVFLLLFLINRWLHRAQGEMPISAVSRKGTVNVASAFGSTTFGVIERAFDRSVLTKQNFYLEVTSRILEVPGITGGLRRLDVSPGRI